MASSFTGRNAIRRDGRDHFAEVTVRAASCEGPSEVILLPTVLDYLRETFGTDYEHHRHCVWSAVSVQISTANVAGELPFVGATSFRAEVTEVKVSGDAGREVSGFLLSVAGMDAIGDYLADWETRTEADNPPPPGTVVGSLPFSGYPPPLAGLRCEAILRVEFWNAGLLVNPVNDVHFCFEGRWHCLDFHHGIVSWKSGGAYAGNPQNDASTPVVDMAVQRGLVGIRLLRYVMEPIGRGASVTFEFENGHRLAFCHVDGVTSYHDA